MDSSDEVVTAADAADRVAVWLGEFSKRIRHVGAEWKVIVLCGIECDRQFGERLGHTRHASQPTRAFTPDRFECRDAIELRQRVMIRRFANAQLQAIAGQLELGERDHTHATAGVTTDELRVDTSVEAQRDADRHGRTRMQIRHPDRTHTTFERRHAGELLERCAFHPHALAREQRGVLGESAHDAAALSRS